MLDSIIDRPPGCDCRMFGYHGDCGGFFLGYGWFDATPNWVIILGIWLVLVTLCNLNTLLYRSHRTA